jgi:Ca-activated chloride channel family protein
MRAEDVGETRLDRAKQLAWQLAAVSPGDRIGLVVFGGAGFLQLPPTTDFGTFQLFLGAASPDQIGDPATDLSAPIRVALHTLRREGTPSGSRAIVLLSDGESSEPLPRETLDSLRVARVPVFAIGVGTAEGARMPSDSGSEVGPWFLDPIGRQVITRLSEDDLKAIAMAGDGGYARWDDPQALERVSRALASLQARMMGEQQATEPTERYQWPLAIAVVLLCLDLLLGLPGKAGQEIPQLLAKAAAILLVVGTTTCGKGRQDQLAGRELYEAGKFDEAYQAFSRAAVQDGNPAVRYNSGNAQYRMRHYLDAAKAWQSAQGGSTRLKEWTWFNLGNAYLRADQDAEGQGDHLRRSIAAYEEALRIDPGDQEAKWNLELALRRRGDTDGPGSRGGGRAMAGRGQMREEGYEGARESAVGAMAGGGQGEGEGESAPELDSERARLLLETIEREQLASHEGRRAQSGPTGDRDW